MKKVLGCSRISGAALAFQLGQIRMHWPSARKARSVLFIALYSFSFLCWASWKRVDENTISLEGDVDESSYADYIAVAGNGFTRVLLNSKGGNPAIALKIAEDIATRGKVEIRVGDACASACANYLAIASNGRFKAKCDSIVAWHGTIDLDDELSIWRQAGAPKKLLDEYRQWFMKFNKREREFYRKMGVDYIILADSVTAVSQANIESNESYGVDEETGDVNFSVSAAAWIPAFSDLSKYGVFVESACMNRTHKQTEDIIGNPSFKFASDPVAH